jgi:hypothetical protein
VDGRYSNCVNAQNWIEECRILDVLQYVMFVGFVYTLAEAREFLYMLEYGKHEVLRFIPEPSTGKNAEFNCRKSRKSRAE